MAGCTASPCQVKIGSTVSSVLTFQTKAPISDALTCDVFGVFNGATVPFPGTPVCKQTSKGADGKVVYELGLTVPSIAPKVSSAVIEKAAIGSINQGPGKQKQNVECA